MFQDTEYVFVQNFHSEAVEIKEMKLYGEEILGEKGEMLEPFGTLILKRKIEDRKM